MNKKAKIMLVLLSAATMTAGVLGIAGCKKTTSDKNTKDVYAAYVQYTEDKGETPMDYEQWLATIKGELFIKGDTGATGPTGPTGPEGQPGQPGRPGDNGVSITDVTLSEDGKSLEITYSNGEKDNVTLPEAVTHVHAYDDDNVITLIPASAEADGLGYKKCTDAGCDHIELVIISQRYLVTVTDTAGDPISGAVVTINGAKATTGSNGVANVHGYGYKNDYIVAVEKSGMVVAGTVRAGNESAIDVTMINEFDTTTYRNDPYPAIKKEGVYNVTINSEDYGGGQIMVKKTMVLLCNETDEYKNYSITLGTVEAVNAKVQDEAGNSLLKDGSTNFTMVVAPHKQTPVNFWYDMAKFEMNGHKAGESITYTAAVEEIAVPEIGTETLRAEATGDTEITIPAGKTDWVYYIWENVSEDVLKVNFSMTNVQVEFTAKEGAYTKTDKSPTTAVQGENIVLLTKSSTDWWDPQPNAFLGTYKFRVKLIDNSAEGKFTLNQAADPGTLTKPFAYNAGDEAGKISQTAVGSGNNLYTKVTVPDTGKYYIKWTNCHDVRIFNEKPASVYVSSDKKINNTDTIGAFDIVELDAGEYYVRATSDADDFELVFRKYSVTADKGVVAENPIALEGVSFDAMGKYTFEKNHTGGVYEKVYYSFKAPTKGTVSVAMDQEYIGSIELSNGSTFEKDADVVICITFTGYSDTEATYTVTWVEDKTVDPGTDPDIKPTVDDYAEHTFTAKDADGNKLTGVTVTLTANIVGGDGEVTTQEFTGATNADGEVKFSFLPGAYEVSVGGAYADNAEYKLSKKENVVKNQRSFDIVYAIKKSHVIEIVDSKGVKVTGVGVAIVLGEENKLTATATDGTATLSFFPGSYKIELTGYDEAVYLYEGASTSASANKTTVTLRNDSYTYNLTVKSGTTAIANTEVRLEADGTVYGKGTTNANGEVSIKLYYPKSGVSALKVNVVFSEAQKAEYGFALDVLPEIKKADEPETASVAVEVAQKTNYTVTVLSPSGVAVENVKVTFLNGTGSSAKTIGTADTDSRGVVNIKAVAIEGGYRIVCSNLPAGTNAAEMKTADGVSAITIRLATGDKAVTGANGNDMASLEGDACAMVMGINVLTNTAAVNYYKYSASGSGTFVFNITDKSETSYIDYLKVGDDVLIANGQQQLVKYGVVLGANRGINKAYEVKITLDRSAQVVIGYNTGISDGAVGQITIAEQGVVKPANLHTGENNLTFTDGLAMLVYDAEEEVDLILTWEGDATVTIDGQVYTKGERVTLPAGECNIFVESELDTLILTAEFKAPLQRYEFEDGVSTSVTLDDGYAQGYFVMQDDYNNGLTFTWDESLEIVVTVDGETIENGVQWMPPMAGLDGDTAVIEITSETLTNDEITITIVESPLPM